MNLVACVLKRRKRRELEMFLFCLWKKFTVFIMHLRVFNFSAYETELELNSKVKLLENVEFTIGK